MGSKQNLLQMHWNYSLSKYDGSFYVVFNKPSNLMRVFELEIVLLCINNVPFPMFRY